MKQITCEPAVVHRTIKQCSVAVVVLFDLVSDIYSTSYHTQLCSVGLVSMQFMPHADTDTCSSRLFSCYSWCVFYGDPFIVITLFEMGYIVFVCLFV